MQKTSFRVLTTLLSLSTLAFLLPQIGSIESRFRLAQYFDANSKEARSYDRYIKQFPSQEGLIVTVPIGQDLNTSLSAMESLAERLRRIKGIRSLEHLGSIEIPTRRGEEIIFEKAYPRHVGDSRVAGRYLSYNQKWLNLFIELEFSENEIEEKIRATREIESILRDENARLAGFPHFYSEMRRYMKRDSLIFNSLLILILVLGPMFFLRSLSAGVIPFLVGASACAFSIGLFGFLSRYMSPLSSLFPVMILVTSYSDAVFIMSSYSRDRDINRAIRSNVVPCFLTSLTTALALLSQGFSTLIPVRDFGIFAALGLLWAFVFSFTVVPLLITLLKPKARPLRFSLNFNYSPRVVLSVSLVVALLSAFSFTRIDFRFSNRDRFHEDAPILKTLTFLESSFNMGTNLELLIFLPEKFPSLSNQYMKLEEFLAEMATHPQISRVDSLFDRLRRQSKTLFETADIPKDNASISQILFWNELSGIRPSIRKFLSKDQRILKTSFTMKNFDDELARQFKAKAEQLAPEGYEVRLAGSGALWASLSHLLLTEFALSLVGVIFVFFLIFLALYRSLSFALIALLPNLFSVLLLMGSLVLLGFKLNIVTISVAVITLGLAADDTIHFLHHFRKSGSVETTLRQVSFPVTVTSILLMIGFSILLLASLKPSQSFGILMMIGVASAWVGDLFLLPALLRFFSVKAPPFRVG